LLSHPFFREFLSIGDEVSEKDLSRAREILDRPFGLAYCILHGYRARAEKDLARLLARSSQEDGPDWRPIQEAPDDLSEGLFAVPDGSGGFQQMVIYGYVPSRRPAYSALYDPHGVQSDPDEPAAMSAKEIALESGATQWRPIPSQPPCSR